jgi:NAD-dependent dihydropyrimidine dehydrogenase PreA subunit
MAATMIRKIIHIDEEKCTGCGLCIPTCHEGAIAIIDGKARLIGEKLCDGLGNCLGTCPQDAIHIEEREAEEFDEAAVKAHTAAPVTATPMPVHTGFSCPSARSFTIERQIPVADSQSAQPSQLGQWPVQLHLVPANAPYFQDADLLLAADCVPFAYAGFHSDLLAGKAVAIGCPKLDDGEAYLAKLTAILHQSTIRSITIAYMEVPCCYGLVHLVQLALAASGKEIPVELKKISIHGEIS